MWAERKHLHGEATRKGVSELHNHAVRTNGKARPENGGKNHQQRAGRSRKKPVQTGTYIGRLLERSVIQGCTLMAKICHDERKGEVGQTHIQFEGGMKAHEERKKKRQASKIDIIFGLRLLSTGKDFISAIMLTVPSSETVTVRKCKRIIYKPRQSQSETKAKNISRRRWK